MLSVTEARGPRAGSSVAGAVPPPRGRQRLDAADEVGPPGLVPKLGRQRFELRRVGTGRRLLRRSPERPAPEDGENCQKPEAREPCRQFTRGGERRPPQSSGPASLHIARKPAGVKIGISPNGDISSRSRSPVIRHIRAALDRRFQKLVVVRVPAAHPGARNRNPLGDVRKPLYIVLAACPSDIAVELSAHDPGAQFFESRVGKQWRNQS